LQPGLGCDAQTCPKRLIDLHKLELHTLGCFFRVVGILRCRQLGTPLKKFSIISSHRPTFSDLRRFDITARNCRNTAGVTSMLSDFSGAT